MKPRILLADDDVSVRNGLTRVLELEGYEVISAPTGHEALAHFFYEGPPDLAVLDLHMPDKDGWHALRLMTHRPPDFPVILITGSPVESRRARALGATVLMEKPLDPKAFLDQVHALLPSDGASFSSEESTTSDSLE